MPKGFIESWNGSAWSIQPSPNVTVLSILDTVSCVKSASCWAAGSAVTSTKGTSPGLQSLIEKMVPPPRRRTRCPPGRWRRRGSLRGPGPPSSTGRWAASRSTSRSSDWPLPRAAAVTGRSRRHGGVFSFGDAPFYGSMGGKPLNKPIVGCRADARRQGLLAGRVRMAVSSCSVTPSFYGSMGGKPPNQPIASIAPTVDGKGDRLEPPPTAGSSASVMPRSTGRWVGSPPTSRVVGHGADAERYRLPGSSRLRWPVLVRQCRVPQIGPRPGASPASRRSWASSPTPDGGGYWIAGAGGIGLCVWQRRLLGLDRPDTAGRADRRRRGRLIPPPRTGRLPEPADNARRLVTTSPYRPLEWSSGSATHAAERIAPSPAASPSSSLSPTAIPHSS